MGTCAKCAAGTFQDEEGQTACKVCEPGSYCPAGAATPLPCIKGSYSSATNLTSADECKPTTPGFYAASGSTSQTPCSPGTVAPSTSMRACDKCAAGTFQDKEGQTACEPCRAGSYCAEGAAAALPCNEGTYSTATSLKDAASCTPTDVGHFASTGSTVQTPCSPGTVAPIASMGMCDACEAGTFQDEPGQEACMACAPGSYCPLGASAPLPCIKGSYSSATNLTSADECKPTTPGFYAASGSTSQTPCSPGTVAPSTSMRACDKCAAGTFQDKEGQTACEPCRAGSYCAEGAAAALPCNEGTYSTATSLKDAASCTPTDVGHFASTGSTVQTPCSPGTVAPIASMGMCDACEAGTFQDEPGQEACKACAPGYYCSGRGASASTPCPGGTWSNATGLSSWHQCTKVVRGEWAPIGSTAAKLCPASGFYCPGYDADTINNPPGSEPIIIDSGASRKTRKVPVISFEVTLEAELADYNEDDTKVSLALLYNVSADAISLTVEAGSLKLSVTILPVDRSEGGVAALTSAIESKSMAEMSALLGSNATISDVQMGEKEEEYEATCPKGHWCSVGLDIACSESTYNDKLDQHNQGACKPCPPNSLSAIASVSVDACVCAPGYYDNTADDAAAPRCVLCKTGSNCLANASGISLATLPLMPGYYRISNSSDDLRRCPDFGESSGCVGGVGFGEGPCREWLSGPYCRLCNVSDMTRYFNPDESACLPCEGDAGPPLALGFSLLTVTLAVILLWVHFKPHRNVHWLARLVPWMSRLSAQLSLRPKGKQLLGFCE